MRQPGPRLSLHRGGESQRCLLALPTSGAKHASHEGSSGPSLEEEETLRAIACPGEEKPSLDEINGRGTQLGQGGNEGGQGMDG